MAIQIKYYVHGRTTDNEAGIATGWLPGEICKVGWEQLAKLKDIVEKEKFDAIFCSDLFRAVETAKYLFGDRYKIIPDKRLRECNYGLWNGKANMLVKSNMLGHVSNPFPEGESYLDVQERVSSFIEFLKKEFPMKRVAVLAHQGPQLSFDVLLKNKTWPEAINEDWRKTKNWQPGWDYTIN